MPPNTPLPQRAHCFWKHTPPSPKVVTPKGNRSKNSLMKLEAIIFHGVYGVLQEQHGAGKRDLGEIMCRLLPLR